MLEYPLARLEGEIEPVEGAVALLQQIHDAQALQIVLEAAVRLHAGVECVLPCVSERCMTQIMSQRDRFGQVLLQAMSKPGAEEVAFVVDEDLRLVFEAAERVGVDDAVAVALVFAPPARRRFAVEPAAGVLRPRRVRGELTPGHAPCLRRAPPEAPRAAPRSRQKPRRYA